MASETIVAEPGPENIGLSDRVSRLEGAYGHLATKADLAELKADLTAAIASQTRWLASLVLASAAAAVGVVIAVDRLFG
jgi:hypothetical protein